MKKETINRTIEIEGGFQNDKTDRGNYTPTKELKGTKYGISARAYPELDIENLTKSEAFEIYERDYWAKVIHDVYPDEIKPMMFDMAVNHGVFGANKILQRSVGVKDDGVVGNITLRAVKQRANLNLLACERNLYFATIVSNRISQAKFIKGWVSRTKEIVEFTLNLIQ